MYIYIYIYLYSTCVYICTAGNVAKDIDSDPFQVSNCHKLWGTLVLVCKNLITSIFVFHLLFMVE